MDTEHTNDYGMHLIVDGYDANPQALRDIARAYRFLDELPARIGMQKIGPPQLSNFDDPMMAGITGIIQIVTSHISIHTYANKGCVFLDVFSCQTLSDTSLRHWAGSFLNIGSGVLVGITKWFTHGSIWVVRVVVELAELFGIQLATLDAHLKETGHNGVDTV